MNYTLVKFLTKLKSYSFLKKEYLTVEYSEAIFEIIKLLYNEGYLQSYRLIENNLKLLIYVILRYFFNKPIFKNLKLISTNSKKKYLNFSLLNKISSKKFTIVVSTSNGILSLNECKKKKLGGILLFYC
jgi:small subunit ribosomal protein S8